MAIRIKILPVFLVFFCLFHSVQAEEITIVNLKTEYTITPLGMDIKYPRFSWQMKSNEPGCHQTAYQIIVSDENQQKMWDSEIVPDSISLNIRYAGLLLKPCTRYTWKVLVWDGNQKKYSAESWFETGLMNQDPGLSAWDGAQWIGGGDKDMVLYSSYLPVFKLQFAVQLDKASESVRAGFIYGANDNRLMNKYKNLYRLENKKDSSYILIVLDINALNAVKAAEMHIYRVGYSSKDNRNIPIKTFSIPLSVLNDNNKYEKHTVSISSVLGNTQIYINGTEKENLIGRVNLNPLGNGGDFIAFPMVADIGFFVPKGQKAYFSNLEIRHYRSPSNIIFSEDLNKTPYQGIFSGFQGNISVKESSYQVEGKSQGAFFTANPSRNSMPMLRTTFSASKSEILKARLYITSRGIYEIYLNGNRIGSDYFNPGLTQYTKTHLYQTYDVTGYMHPDKNALGAILSEGWWSGGSTYMGEFWNFFGDRQSVLAKLVITYTDGKKDVIVTNPDTWTYFNNGPILYSSFFQGEVYDAAKETLVKGWTTVDYKDSAWQKATKVIPDGNISKSESNRSSNMPMVDDYSGMSLTGQIGETVKKVKELSSVSFEEVQPGVYVYDMGQNMAGVPKIYLKNMEPGKRIVMRFAEVKYPDLPEYKENAGMIMLENIRAAMAQDIYITTGGSEIISPRFTYHGYRYIEITGINKPLPLESVKSEVLSSLHELASKYETSNPLVNKLWENITWSSFANFMSIPTDCPQRNERLGWSGDISVFSRTATYLADVSQFFRRHMLAMRDVQREDGRFSDVAPLGGGFGETLWGSAGITVAWESFQQYGDRELLKEHYGAMKKYIEYLIKEIDTETGVMMDKGRDKWYNLGDWLSLEDKKNEKALFWESYFIFDLDIMQKAATILGQKEDAERFARLRDERKEFFNKTFVDNKSGKTVFRNRIIDTQTSYVLPFAFNIFKEKNRNAALENFKASITRENKTDQGIMCPPFSLMTGFIGTAWINKALSDNGYSDVAYKLLQQTSYPSWLYPVEQGATTIWERLNSYTHLNGFGGNNRMNSFNHYSFGAVGAWMYNYSLGITRDENSSGFKHFILQPEPEPTGKMTFAKGYYNSMYGRIESGWERKKDTLIYRFVIPANTTATVYIPADNEKHIRVNGKTATASKGVKFLQIANGKAIFEVVSGEYFFINSTDI